MRNCVSCSCIISSAAVDRNQRGGKEAAPFWEWGGKGASGDDEFDRHRPGWGKPIHQLLVDHGASVVFHGHDHMFIKQDLDGIVYQLVPQPGHPRSGTKSAEEYGYLSGEVQGSSGHVRVRVDGDSARVDYVRAYLPEAERGQPAEWRCQLLVHCFRAGISGGAAR